MGADPSLTPDAVQAYSFTAGFRGYDQAEVRQFLSRVAHEIRSLTERAEQLESMWHSAEERAARPPVLDEDSLMAAVGEETASILRAARSAAADVRNRAGADADRIVTEAQEAGAAIRTEADAVLGRETAAAQAAATQILDAARSEAAQLVDRARQEADGIRASAQQDKQLTIEGASATRERILDDLSRRRRVASVQIEQLRAGRERLIEVYALVRRTLDEVQQELSRADAEARAAADAAGRRMQAETPESESALDEPEAFAESVADELASGNDDEPPEAAGAPPDTGRDAGDVTLTGPASSVDLTVPPPAPPAPEAAMPARNADREPASGKAAKAGSKASRLFRHHGAARGEAAVQAEALSTPPTQSASVPHLRVVRVVPDPHEPEAVEIERAAAEELPAPSDAATEAAAEPAPAGEPAPQEATAEEEKAEAVPADGGEAAGEIIPGSKVDLLFARIRAGRDAAEPTDGSATSPDEAAADETATAEHESEETGSELPRSDADEALLQRREAAVTGLEMALTRKLKRGLQDEQNDLLDRLRSLRSQPTAARLLPDLDAQTARYTSAAQPLVDKAAAAGAAFAAEVRGKKPSKSGAPVVADLATEAATSIVEPLRRRLEQAISSAAGDDQSVLVEALGSAYREWKSQRIERIAGDTLSAAFSRGTWHEVPAGTPLRWVVDDVDGPCPDCDDDALAGSLPKGEEFPTGQPHPPAHSGCRCLLVPDVG